MSSEFHQNQRIQTPTRNPCGSACTFNTVDVLLSTLVQKEVPADPAEIRQRRSCSATSTARKLQTASAATRWCQRTCASERTCLEHRWCISVERAVVLVVKKRRNSWFIFTIRDAFAFVIHHLTARGLAVEIRSGLAMLFQSAWEEEQKLDVFYHLDKENRCVSQQGTFWQVVSKLTAINCETDTDPVFVSWPGSVPAFLGSAWTQCRVFFSSRLYISGSVWVWVRIFRPVTNLYIVLFLLFPLAL